ncbi:MAG: tetratricopeptide repeat protein [Anaerolineae bacterium]|nr:tetratricopeptide repeat protein [Anaerolineae bacterium]
MARLTVRLLGAFQVTLEGEPVDGFRSDKVRALLAYLCVASDGPHRREKLAGLLWPDSSESAARTNLRQALADLRQVIGDDDAAPPFFHISRQTIQFNQGSNAWVDVAAFAALTARPRTIERLEEAVALYRGEFLEGFSLPDSPPFEEWALLQREQSHRLGIAALHDLIETYAERGDLERALQRTWDVLELDPWREQAHRWAMRLMALTGQRAAALAQYETCRGMLAEEFGVDPATETTALYEEIRSGGLGTAAPIVAPECAAAGELPASLIPFVGRERELEQVTGLLQDPVSRLVTLFGPGGSGKTRLIVEAARIVGEHFADGVYFVSLAPVASADAVVPTLAQALGFCFSPAEGTVHHMPREQLLTYLRGKQMLLILDNFEHLLAGASVVADILTKAPGVKVAITSRAKLNLRGEQVFPLVGMEYPAPKVGAEPVPTGPEDMAAYSAIRLFLQSARQARPDFEATGRELGEIARICHLVQGMPLGILLAAAWVDVLTVVEIAAEVEKSLDFLESEWREVPDRQRSLRAVFDHSWSLLTDRERAVFQALSVFRGGFTREAAEAVGASLRDLQNLAGKSFLQQMPASGRYEVHELLRQYASERLTTSPAAETAARDRHSAHYVAALAHFAADLTGPRQQAALAEVQADSENARVAWEWAVAHGQIDRLDRAMDGLAHFYHRRGRYQEGEAAFRTATERFATAGRPGSRSVQTPAAAADRLRVWTRALTWQAYFSRALGRRELATQLREQAAGLLERPELADHETRAERALLYQHMGRAVFLSDYEQARHYLEESLNLYRELGDVWSTAAAQHSLGTAALFRGAYADARHALEESLKLSRGLDDQESIAWNMADLTFIALFQGRFEEGLRLARDSRAITQALGGLEGIGLGLLALGAALLYTGELSQAHAALQASLRAFNELGRRGWITLAHAGLSRTHLHLGRYDEARVHAERALAHAEETALRLRVGQALVLLGWVAVAQEAYDKAHLLLEGAMAIFQDIGASVDVGWVHLLLAYAARGEGQADAMRRTLREALLVAGETGADLLMLSALPAAALLLADQGESERAVALYALASRCEWIAASSWFDDVVGRSVAAAAASLPPDVVAVAKSEGHARDLRASAEEILREL